MKTASRCHIQMLPLCAWKVEVEEHHILEIWRSQGAGYITGASSMRHWRSYRKIWGNSLFCTSSWTRSVRFTGRKESFPVFHQTNGLPIDFYIINSADPFRFLQRSVLIHVIPFPTDLLPASLHFAVFVQIILCVFYGGLHIHIRRGIARTTAATAEVPRNNSFFLTLFMGCK